MSPVFDRSRRHALQSLAAAAGAATGFPALAQDNEIRIGQSIHLTGPMAATTSQSLKGQALALDEVNRAGGVNGRPVKLIQLDDQYDAQRCVANVKSLIDTHKVSALFGLANSQAIGATLPLLAERKMPLIGIYSGSPALRVQQHPCLFTTAASFRDEVVQMVRNLVAVQQADLGVVYLDNPFGQLMLPVAEQVIQEHGATLVGKQALEATGANAAEVSKALAANRPKAVLLMAFGPSTVAFVKAARKLIGVPIYALSITNVAALLQAMGEDARGLAITQTVPYPWRETSGITRDFNTAARREQLPVTYEAMLGYVNARVLVEGLKRSGKAPTPEAVIRGFESMSKVDLGGYEVSYGPKKHHGSAFVEITIVGPDGKFIR
ncbi:ABC transporter substrate-binding protein [Piscinibacter gummiphilus]|uniref:ABC transporter substrate-binding protein n=1 Tax=Piscinibacter gummiphilus TaxID=946333 RepID=A0A1W6LD19_9BURK|nr:ABC transporter substrate-binding protein [Piscinibacter gummiphilus]ARN22150.1 ABC transporter substrate-binding protein [Piscinibacter gummiphilus]ATU66837.1 ABC transporter substrate-binding protein [Piscinibacter gummiphilus]GLS94240.1 lipoprotein [Piscinibacter gummiphilus]